MKATPMQFIPRPDDSENVREALRHACVLWAGQEHGGALQSLRHAIECAGDDGNDKRMLELSKALADLMQAVARPLVPPRPVPPPLPPRRAGAPRRLPPPLPQSARRAGSGPTIPPILAP
jgi:hypothetical protein